MLNIYTPKQAAQTILRRDNAFDDGDNLPDSMRERSRAIFGEPLPPTQAVKHILADVRQRGDTALRDWTHKIDGIALDRITVDPADFAIALEAIPTDLRAALEFAAKRIRQFHSYQPLPNWTTTEMGGRVGQRVTPIDRVGVYVPGGTAPLPSSLLMGVIPAQVAGVKEIVVATPPSRDGRVPQSILAAAAIVGVDKVVMLGGAQAVGAMAFGSESVPHVDKIVGPGNLFVTLAKQQVYGIVGIDGLYGPTETAVIADEHANAVWIAADLLAQAEHDVLASAILFTPSLELATAVQAEVEAQFDEIGERQQILLASLSGQSGIVLTADLDEACQLASAYAPEHLCFAVENPHEWTDKVAHAGGLFIGERSFEVLGDYVAGPSHTMPTGGTARFASPLNVSDFVKINSIIELDDATSAQLSPIAARIARAEELYAHANAAQKRVENGE